MIDPIVGDDKPVSTSNKTLRQFAGLCILFFGGLSAWQYYWHGPTTFAYVLAGLAVIGPLGLVLPQAIRPVFTLAMTITYPIGWVVSHVLLGVTFFGMFTLVALIFRLIGRDALNRRLQAQADDYWMVKPPVTDLNSYLHQS